MSRLDIDLALQLIAERLPRLRPPRRIDARAFAAGSHVLGQYRYFTDTMRLNARYLEPLDDVQALDLLDTVLHELLHKNSSLLRQLRDTWFAHPEIWREAARLRDLLEDDFLSRRNGQNVATETASADRFSTVRLRRSTRFSL